VTAVTDYIATISTSHTGAMVAVTPEDREWDPVALEQPSAAADPREVLAGMGYRLADAYNPTIADTIHATRYAKVRVVPTGDKS
jgi:hypothetical protein